MPAHPNTHTSTAVQALPAPVVVMQAMMAKSCLIRAYWRQAGAQASRQPPQIHKVSTGGFKSLSAPDLYAKQGTSLPHTLRSLRSIEVPATKLVLDLKQTGKDQLRELTKATRRRQHL